MSLSCECCVLSGRGLCDISITRPEESYRLWCVCDREASTMRRPWPTMGCCAMKIINSKLPIAYIKYRHATACSEKVARYLRSLLGVHSVGK
jgi:hypothetical protein